MASSVSILLARVKSVKSQQGRHTYGQTSGPIDHTVRPQVYLDPIKNSCFIDGRSLTIDFLVEGNFLTQHIEPKHSIGKD